MNWQLLWLRKIEAERHDVIILNFANPDMVGHSGLLEPTMKAIEATDDCLGQVVEAVLAKGGVCLHHSDHGNADMVTNADGSSIHSAYNESCSFYCYGQICYTKRRRHSWQILPQRCLDFLEVTQPERNDR